MTLVSAFRYSYGTVPVGPDVLRGAEGTGGYFVAKEARVLINMIGTDEEHVVDLETWKGEPVTDPTDRETLSMAVAAAVASFAAGSPDASSASRDVSPVSGITQVERDGPSTRVHAA